MELPVRNAVRYAAALVAPTLATFGVAAHAAEARLVHCGPETCLRLSGTRADAGAEVRIGGRRLAVGGGRHWQATVPLALARGWTTSLADALPVTVTDVRSGAERTEVVSLPPGALGRHVELVALMVRAD